MDIKDIQLPQGWEKDWVREYRKLKAYYKQETLKNNNPLFDMIFKKIAYYSVKLDCAMCYMEQDICPPNFIKDLNTLSNGFMRQIDQLLKYTMPIPKDSNYYRNLKKKVKPIGEMTDDEILEEIKRVESIARE